MEPGAHGHGAALGRLVAALAAVSVLLAGELVSGWLTHSLALLGDAGHLLTDVFSLGLAVFAVRRSFQPASSRHTFGHHRSGILVAAINGLALLIVAAVLAAAAISRLAHPSPVIAGPVIVVAAIAFCLNGGIALLLRGAGTELSVRSALLHIVADAAAAAGVLVSGVVILITGWQAADSIASLLIAVLISAGAVHLLREAQQILGEGTPQGVDAEAVRHAILDTAGVEGVHDLHIWSIDRSHRALSAHITVADRPLGEVTAVLQAIEARLCSEHGIEHATLQPECPACVVAPTLFCDLDQRHSLVHEEVARVTTRR